jgi:hypothetical protein
MAFTLFDLVLDATKKVGVTRASIATGGTSATLIDSGLVNNSADGDYVDGTLFVITAVAASSSIDGQMREITGYTAAAGTFAFSSLAASVTAGTLYAYTTPEFSYALMLELANDALRNIGNLVYTDRTMVSSAAQDVYSLSSAFKYSPPIKVEYQGNKASSNLRPEWIETTDWEYEPSAAGSAGALRFKFAIPVGRDVRVWYEAQHPRLTGSTSCVDERIHPELAIASLVEKMYEYRNSLNRGSVTFDLQRWNDAQTKLEQARLRYPIWRQHRRSKYMLTGADSVDHLPWAPPYGPT